MSKTALADVSTTGAFVRQQSVFRNAIEKGGRFPPAAGRYVLIVSYACPWASRCLAVRRMKGLEDAIALAAVSPVWAKTRPDVDDHEGWMFVPDYDDATTADPTGFNAPHVRGIYEKCIEALGGNITTRFTVPILFDKETQLIVNNESSEIIRFLNSEFNDFATHPEVDLYPPELRAEIDAVNEANYDSVSNGVYRCGFAQSQAAYTEAATALFARLEELEALLATRRFLCGARVTEADIRLFVTLVRFDDVYVCHFKTAKFCIREKPNLTGWMRDVYQTCDLAPTVNRRHIVEHYFMSHRNLNPFGIIPIVPELNLGGPHGRAALSN